jgi:thioredoxin 2
MDPSSVHVVCPHCGAINRIPAARSAKEAKCGRCHRPLSEGKPLPVTTEAFERHRTRNEIPIVVDFWAPWCRPCLAMAPAYERAAAELEPEFRLLKVNTEEEPDLAARYDIRSIPTMMMFAKGRRIAQIAGAMSGADIVDWVRSQAQEQMRQPGTVDR